MNHIKVRKFPISFDILSSRAKLNSQETGNGEHFGKWHSELVELLSASQATGREYVCVIDSI
jgi:hypothetical protein